MADDRHSGRGETMSKRGKKTSRARDKPAQTGPAQTRSLVWYGDWSGENDLTCAGYTSLSQNPEIVTAVDTIARLVGAMTIHLMRNTERGDVRVINGLSNIVDIEPNRIMTRSNFVRWIVKTMLLDGDGNAVVYPVTDGGYLRELVPIPAAYTAFIPSGDFDYRVYIAGREYDPGDVLHFVANPGDFYPWLGVGYRVALADVADCLKQATHTAKGFMSSKWKPSLIVKVDALTDEFSTVSGRQKLLNEYAQSGEAGEPWLIPAEQFDVKEVKPLTLSDLALADFVKLDKQTVAAILGVPPFVLGVGDYSKEAWNNFVNTTIMPIAQTIQQELTRKLLYSPDLFFRFNARSLYNYALEDLVKAGAEMVDRMAMRRNEWRDWMGLPPDPDMDDLLALENYIPADRLGDQKKLVGGDTE